MTRSRPTILMVALSALLLLVLGAGPASQATRAQEEVELRIWDQFTGPESDTVDAIYEGFEEANPNITIEREPVDPEQMRETTSTALASGTGPDLLLTDSGPGYSGLLKDAGLIRSLDEYAAQYGWADRFAASALEASQLDGELYALPLTIDLVGLYYNAGLIEEAGLQVPETFEDLVTFCGEAADAGYTAIAFANNPGWQAFHQFAMTSNGILGTEAMRALIFENQGTWDSPEIVSAIQTFFVDLREAGCFNEDPNALMYEDGTDLFYTEQALMTPTGSWLINDIQENMPDADVRFVPFPALPGSEERVWPSGVGSAYLVSAATEHPEEVGAFLDYLTSPETAQRWVGEASFFLPSQVDTSAIEVSPLFQSVIDVLESSANGETQLGYNVDVLAPAEFNDAMQNGFQAVLAGDKTAEEQAADLQAAWEEGQAS